MIPSHLISSHFIVPDYNTIPYQQQPGLFFSPFHWKLPKKKILMNQPPPWCLGYCLSFFSAPIPYYINTSDLPPFYRILFFLFFFILTLLFDLALKKTGRADSFLHCTAGRRGPLQQLRLLQRRNFCWLSLQRYSFSLMVVATCHASGKKTFCKLYSRCCCEELRRERCGVYQWNRRNAAV